MRALGNLWSWLLDVIGYFQFKKGDKVYLDGKPVLLAQPTGFSRTSHEPSEANLRADIICVAWVKGKGLFVRVGVNDPDSKTGWCYRQDLFT